MLQLVIGDKNLSSWSLRAWILLRHLGLEFEEIRLPLDTPRFHDEIVRYSPARRVPVLIDGPRRIWDTLAIAEYANELADGQGWPRDAGERAHARSISAEMHSGFQALRSTWILQAGRTGVRAPLTTEAAADVGRIDAIWRDCRERYGHHGPWLFGNYSIADAMYAPVLLRFRTYGAELSSVARAYWEFALSDPALREWVRGAEQELAAAAPATA